MTIALVVLALLIAGGIFLAIRRGSGRSAPQLIEPTFAPSSPSQTEPIIDTVAETVPPEAVVAADEVPEPASPILAWEHLIMLYQELEAKSGRLDAARRKASRQQAVQAYGHMPPDQQQKLRTELQAKWDALPADRKAELTSARV